MTISLVITNLSAAPVVLDDLYTELGANGASNDALTITRSVAEIDVMSNLKSLVTAGTVSVALTESSDNTDILSLPIEQHGVVASTLSVLSVAVATQAVTFANAFAAAPVVSLTAMQNATSTAWKGQAYAQSVSGTGFTIALDVTTADNGVHTAEAVVWSPLANGVLLGPFTGTLVHAPITAGAITVHWAESASAKSATITGTSTIGGAQAASVSSALLNRTTGALSITFAAGHPPDTSSLTVDYISATTADISWVATY